MKKALLKKRKGTSIYRDPRVYVAVACVIIIGLIDVLSGHELTISIFYIAPIVYLALNRGRKSAIGVAMFGGVIYAVSDFFDRHSSISVFVSLWNAVINLGFFVLIGYFVSELQSSLRRERRQARHDPLTGVANSRAFHERAELELSRCRRAGCPVTVAYIDLDDFKVVNDLNGHAAGDALLKEIAEQMKSVLRDSDTVARIGGDEFAILLPETRAEAAQKVIERVVARLKELAQRKGWPVSFSAGVVTFKTMPDESGELLHKADELMYEVKKSGKNAVRYAEE